MVDVALVAVCPEHVDDSVPESLARTGTVGHHPVDAGRQVFPNIRKDAFQAEMLGPALAVEVDDL
jgi:hypothetical protein